MTSDEEDDHEAHRIVQEWGVPLRGQDDYLINSIQLGVGGRPRNWIEDEQGGVLPASLMASGAYMELPRRIVQQDMVRRRWFRRYRVSTVFLGLDHNYFPIGPPILYETMVFYNSPLQTMLERLGLGELVHRWQSFRLRVAWTRDIHLPSIVDMTCEWQWRYATRADALAGHLHILDQMRRGVPPQKWGESEE